MCKPPHLADAADEPPQLETGGGRTSLANKTARTIWALMTSGQAYREPKAMAA